MATVKEYLRNIDPSQKIEYDRIRKIVKKFVPDVLIEEIVRIKLDRIESASN